MNRERRNTLKKALKHLDCALDIICDVRDDEQYSLNNLPENLQNSERYEAMESAVENLEDALDKIEETKDSVSCAIA